MLIITYLLHLFGRGGIGACYSTEYKYIGNGFSANAVTGMNATSYLTGCIERRNRIAIFI